MSSNGEEASLADPYSDGGGNEGQGLRSPSQCCLGQKTAVVSHLTVGMWLAAPSLLKWGSKYCGNLGTTGSL